MNRKTIIALIVVALLTVVLTACSANAGSNIPYASIPAGRAYADGKEVYFSHTEVSDSSVGEKLTNMMKSPVLVVPALADAPDSMLAPVYVFTNGITGKGPLGFQPDVFSLPPGTDGYTPMRKITFVTWVDGVAAKELKAESEILAGVDAGELTLEVSGVVVNMPFMTWDGGKR
jgi:hypothetical protein